MISGKPSTIIVEDDDSCGMSSDMFHSDGEWNELGILREEVNSLSRLSE